jgi:hypothetical protein
VLPLLCLVDAVPAHADVLGAFLRDLTGRSNALKRRLGLAPLVLVDELDHLLHYAGDPPPFDALSRIDQALLSSSITVVATLGGRRGLGLGLGHLPVQTVFELTAAAVSIDPPLRSLVLNVASNMRTGSTCRVPLILDSSSGLLAC